MIAGVVEGSQKPIIACLGNCQSGAIRAFLLTVPEISRDYDVVLVYQKTSEFEALRPRVRAVIQQVTHGWDDFRLTEEELPPQTTIIRYPAMLLNYLWPLIPFQKRREGDQLPAVTKLFPYTICDDMVLRLVDQGVPKSELLDAYFAVDVTRKYPLGRLRQINEAKARQIDDMADFGVWDRMESGQAMMRTANHPGGPLMAHVLEQIVERLPLEDRDHACKLARARAQGPGVQNVDAPVHPAVAEYFGLNWAKDRRWAFWQEGDFTFAQHLLRLYDYRHSTAYWSALDAIKRGEDATVLTARAIEELPESVDILKAHIAELGKAGRVDDVAEMTRRLYALQPAPQTAVRLAAALRRAKAPNEARALLSTLETDDPNVLMAMAHGIEDNGVYRLDLQERAAAIDPDNLQVLLARATAAEQRDDLADALRILDRAYYVSNWAESVRRRRDRLVSRLKEMRLPPGRNLCRDTTETSVSVPER